MTALRVSAVCLALSGAGVVGLTATATGTGSTYASVTDANGVPLSGLAASDFAIEVDGAPRPVVRVAPASEPPAIVVVVNGVQADHAIQIRRALAGIVASTRARFPDARVGFMIAEGSAPPVLRDVTTGAAELEHDGGRFYRSGLSARLLESIEVATRALSAERSRRRIVFAITTRLEAGDRTPPKRIADALRATGTSLWALEYGLFYTAPPGDEEEKVLRDVTRASGGRREVNLGAIGLDAATRRLMAMVLASYVVTYDAPATPGAGELRVGVRRDDALVSAPGWVR